MTGDTLTLTERLQALSETQEITSSCANCDGFEVTGPFRETREAFRAHVAETHPELLPKLAIKRRGQLPIYAGRRKEHTWDGELSVLSTLARMHAAAA